MNSKQITILAIFVAVIGGVYFLVNQKQEASIKTEETAKIGDRAVEDFKVADVTRLAIKQTGQQVTLDKQGDDWVVAERDGYAADATKIRGLLFTIKDMKVAESRSQRGKGALKKLTLLHPDEAGEGGSGAGKAVEISAGDQSRSLVFGGKYNSAGRSGRFIKTGKGSVYVVSTALQNPESDPAAWLDKEFFKVQKPSKIAVQHEKPEDSYTLERESDGSPLELEGATAEEELDTTKISTHNNLFASANFNDYIIGDAAKPETTGLDKAITATIDTADGFNYVVKVGEKTSDGKYYLSYEVGAEIPDPPAPEPEEEAPAPTETTGDAELSEEEKQKKADEEAKKAEEKKAREEKRAEHKRLTEKLAKEKTFAGKVYTVDSFLVAPVLKKRSELLKTEADKEKEAEAAAGGGGGTTPNVISQGPGGEKRITATTPPISIDPKLLEAEREKQEKAAKEKFKKDQDAAAIKKMLEEHKKEKAEEPKEKAPADEAEDGA